MYQQCRVVLSSRCSWTNRVLAILLLLCREWNIPVVFVSAAVCLRFLVFILPFCVSSPYIHPSNLPPSSFTPSSPPSMSLTDLHVCASSSHPWSFLLLLLQQRNSPATLLLLPSRGHSFLFRWTGRRADYVHIQVRYKRGKHHFRVGCKHTSITPYRKNVPINDQLHSYIYFFITRI